MAEDKFLKQALEASKRGLDESMRHAFMVTSVSIAAALCAYLIIISTILPGISIAKVAGGFAALLFLLIGIWTKRARTLRAPVAAFILIATVFILLSMATNGGVTSYIAPLLIIACLISGFFLDIRASLATAAFVSLSVIGFYIIQQFGFFEPSAFDPERIELASVVVLCCASLLCAICVGTLTSHLDLFSTRLASSRAQLESLVENAPVSLAMFDNRMNYIRCSKDWERDHSIHDSEVIGRSHYDLVPGSEDWRDTHLRCLGGAVEKSDGDSFEGPDGTERIVAWEITPWHDVSGKVGGLLMITRDITEQRGLRDDIIRARDAAERALSQKNALLENLSHEIRTPLNAMIGVTQLLSRTDLQPHQEKMVTTVLSSGSSLLSLIGRLLEAAELEDEKAIVEAEPFNLHNMLGETVQSLLPYADALEVDVHYKMHVSNSEVVGDRNRLARAIAYIGSEAIRCAGKGSVAIAVSEINIGIMQFVFTGPQTTSLQTGKSQQAFSQNHLEENTVHDLAKLMGGDFTISNRDDNKFRATLTVALKADSLSSAELRKDVLEKRVKPPRKRQECNTELSVLIVDDDEINRMVMEEALISAGVKINSVISAQRGIDFLSAEPVDVVLMDLHMPEMTGLQAIKHIRSSKEIWRDVAIIVITADARTGSRESSLDAGADDWISKPIDLNELRDKVLHLAGNGKKALAAAS